MNIKEKVKDLEPKIIQWITIEKEVMEEVNRRYVKGILDRKEWNEYFMELVKKYGGGLMGAQLTDYIKIQDMVYDVFGNERVIEGVKRFLDSEKILEIDKDEV